MYTLIGIFAIAVLYGMVRTWCWLHDKAQAFYTGHPKTDKFFEGKLHLSSVFIASLAIVVSLVAMLGFFSSIPGGKIVGGIALVAYLMITVLDGIKGLQRVAGRISGNSNSAATKPADKPADKK